MTATDYARLSEAHEKLVAAYLAVRHMGADERTLSDFERGFILKLRQLIHVAIDTVWDLSPLGNDDKPKSGVPELDEPKDDGPQERDEDSYWPDGFDMEWKP